VGTGVGAREIGYLYGQYKRSNVHHAQKGKGLLWGGVYPFPQATAWGVVHFAKKVKRGDTHRPASTGPPSPITPSRAWPLDSTRTGANARWCMSCQALEEKGDSLKGKRCLITGSGKVRG
jgi:glutamate dehydrogenase/leucine dehydrogenase